MHTIPKHWPLFADSKVCYTPHIDKVTCHLSCGQDCKSCLCFQRTPMFASSSLFWGVWSLGSLWYTVIWRSFESIVTEIYCLHSCLSLCLLGVGDLSHTLQLWGGLWLRSGLRSCQAPPGSRNSPWDLTTCNSETHYCFCCSGGNIGHIRACELFCPLMIFY